jgi:hypothetical protein
VYGRRPPQSVEATRAIHLRLAPHEVLVWDLTARR